MFILFVMFQLLGDVITLDDLERLSRRFLTSNRLVYVEWGWNYGPIKKKELLLLHKENFKNYQ